MKNEMLWLRQELNAIRSFIMSEKSMQDQVEGFASDGANPIPAFIRAWHSPFEDDLEPKVNLKITPVSNQTQNYINPCKAFLMCFWQIFYKSWLRVALLSNSNLQSL